jgi:mevalonate kinase
LNTKSYFANGKLLITGEYLVIKGALALAVPTTLGQHTEVSKIPEDEKDDLGKKSKASKEALVVWKSYYKQDCWFEAEFKLPEVNILSDTNKKTAAYVQKLLREAMILNPDILADKGSILVKNILEFDPQWGLGSSSSLISNVAEWFEIDPYKLFSKIHKGSAYDIACAKAEGPLWFQKLMGSPVAKQVSFKPSFAEQLALVYSGNKQDSEISVGSFLDDIVISPEDKDRITTIGRDLLLAKSQKEFNALLDEHEEIISRILRHPTLKSSRFPDFRGSIKSLGAWGGDFFLVSSEIGFDEIKLYFSNKGMNVIFKWDELILQ